MILDKDQAEDIVLSIYPAASSEQMDALLEATKGHECGDPDVPAYRPWAVAAWLIKGRWQQFKRARSAAGSEVEWASPRSAFDALMDQQARMDASICGIPDEWEAGGTTNPVAKVIF